MEYSESVDRLNRILVRAHRIIQHELLKQGVDDLVPSHGAVLEYLSQAGIPQPVTELVVALKRPKSSITKATDCLEHGGYVFKKPNPGDGRSYLVGLTPAGSEALELFRGAYAAMEKKMSASGSDASAELRKRAGEDGPDGGCLARPLSQVTGCRYFWRPGP